MYICNDCGEVFDEPKEYTVNLSCGSSRYSGCPSCGKDDFEETNKKCPFTGKYIHPSKDLSDTARQLIIDDLNAVLASHVGTYHENKKEVFATVVEEWLEAIL